MHNHTPADTDPEPCSSGKLKRIKIVTRPCHLTSDSTQHFIQHQSSSVNINPSDASKTRTRRIGEAFAVFTFRYRSRTMHEYNSYPLTFLGDLQTMYLIPRSASPVLLEDRPEESLNRDELLRRQKARQDEQAAIKKKLKRERTKDNDSDDDLMMISSNRYANSFR
ncbi:hypothetical protein D6D20_03569 [Aureobasidium pullulans]|uniref:Uncharacterized protein n=1 Tax=Aureobasidium pullulans TaxID=5580 RepID=A0A4S8ZEM1_AURPU|nr:hypothetical protein D6D20_03569 [Aureobasidium pullulans]